MDTSRQDTDDSNNNRIPSTRSLLAAIIVIAIVVFLGLGSLAAHDLQPVTQEHSLGAEVNYLLTHPNALVLLLPFVVIYLIVLGIVTFTGLVLNRLFPRWAAAFADSLDAWLHLLFSRFYARYRQNLRNHLRPLDQGGIPDPGPWSLDLNQVFVDLKIEVQAVGEGQPNPVQHLSPELREKQHRFFDFLTSQHGGAPHLVLIGPPGSGKTTMLRYTAFALASGHRVMRNAHIPVRLRRMIPVILYLREHAMHVQQAHEDALQSRDLDSKYTLEDAVNNYLHLHADDLSVPKGWLLHHLRRGRCLVLLDGLDEVADLEQRRILVRWVQEQIVQYPSCRFVVTSRPHGYKGNTLNDVTVLGMCPYTRMQVQEFVRNWYRATEVRRQGNRDDDGVKLQARLESEKLLRKLDELPAIYALAANPLLLTMICTVHLYKGSLPKRRVELYKDACEVFLVARQRAKGIPAVLTEDQAKGVLAPLAWAMMTNLHAAKNGRRWPKANVMQAIADLLALYTSMSAEDFLRYVHESGLFLELEPGEYGFAHLTFQEYLAAVHANDAHAEVELIGCIGDSWWEETIRLYCAQVDADRASSVIEACLLKDEVLPNAGALALALTCLDEARLVHPETKRRVQEYVDRCVESTETERQHIAAAALIANRQREMIYLGDNTGDSIRFSPTLITSVEYQLFLDESHGLSIDWAPPHWITGHFASGEGHQPVLGVLPDGAVAFCAWLTQRPTSEGKVFRLPRPEEAGILKGNKLSTLQHAAGFWIKADDGLVTFTRGNTALPTTANLQRLETLIHNDLQISVGDTQSTQAYDLTYTTARDQAVARIYAFDSPRARDLARTRALAGGLNIGINLAGDLTHDLIRARVSARVSVHARNLARDLAGSLAFVHTLSLSLAQDLARASASELATDLVRSLKAALARKSVHDSDLARAYVLARTLARTLAHDYSPDHDRLHDLVESLARDLAQAQDLAQHLAQDLDNALDLSVATERAFAVARALSNTRVKGLTHHLSRASERARDLVLVLSSSGMFAREGLQSQAYVYSRLLVHVRTIFGPLTREWDRIRAQDRARALYRSLTRSCSRTQAGANTNILASDLELANDLTSARERASDLVHALNGYDNRGLARATALARALVRVRDREHTVVRVSVRALASDLAITSDSDLVRAKALTDTIVQDGLRPILLTEMFMIFNAEQSTGLRQEPTAASRATAELCLDAYATLAVLKGRREGWLPPTEGILVICDPL